MPEISILPDPSAVAKEGAEVFTRFAEKAIAEGDRFSVALSGGSTPLAMYALLAQKPLIGRPNWSKVYFFWGDERCVPPEHPDSNYREAREALLDRVPVPPENIHRIPGELEPARAAEAYEQVLSAFFGEGSIPRFNLIFLGLGEDGHTASLFPGSPALEERRRWVVSVEHTTPPPPLVARITLTPAVLNNAEDVVFLVTGDKKAERLAQVLREPYQPEKLPAQIVQTTDGIVHWLVDRSAAAEIT